MLELSAARKNKINLADYNSQQDIQNRILMADFSPFDVKVIGEILFSPLKISLKKMARNIEADEKALSLSLQKIAKSGLLEVQGDVVLVDKEMRKYFEFAMERFDPDFKPDMEFLQNLLHKVPIHVLPTWYAIPRTSNNIFESIVEKYLLTPHIYQRYLDELNFGNPIINAIINDLFSAPDYKLSSSDLIAKYNLKREDFEEIMLLLEFNFVCSLCYEKVDDHWLEFLAPFHEWHEYLRFMKKTEVKPVPEPVQIQHEAPFYFIEKMTELLSKAAKKPIDPSHVVEKLCLTELAEVVGNQLRILDAGKNWITLSPENKALYLYRHPRNQILSLPVGERYVREAEKSIKRVLHGEWVYFDEFIQGVVVPLNEQSVIMLKKIGKNWKYTLPLYGEAEHAILKATIFEWLFEMGMVRTGTHKGRDCFSVTHFGRFFFDE